MASCRRSQCGQRERGGSNFLRARCRRVVGAGDRAGREKRRTDPRLRRRRTQRAIRERLLMSDHPNTYRAGPDIRGHFGAYGERFVAETLMPLVLDLEKAYEEAKKDPSFHNELNGLLKHYVGRESPLYFAERLTQHIGGPK